MTLHLLQKYSGIPFFRHLSFILRRVMDIFKRMFRHIFPQRQERSETLSHLMPYHELLSAAVQFTEKEGLPPDSHLVNFNQIQKCPEDTSVKKIAAEVAQGLDEQIRRYRSVNDRAHLRLGGDCGNIHMLVIKYCKKLYPDTPVNLTIGGVIIQGRTIFSFTMEQFHQWRKNKPKIFECHAWVTVGTSYIIDATLGTYMNTRLRESKHFGGILYGKPGKLVVIPIANEPHLHPERLDAIRYHPIVLGLHALSACAPPIRDAPEK